VDQFYAVRHLRRRYGDSGNAGRRQGRFREQGQAVAGGREPDERQHVSARVAESGTEPVRVGVTADLLERRGDAVRRYPAGVGQVRQAEGAAGRQGMSGRQDHRDACLADADGGQRNLLGERVTGGGQPVGEAEVEVAARYGHRYLRARSRLDGDAQPRHPRIKPGQRRREDRSGAR
jgi:hypothetical protein